MIRTITGGIATILLAGATLMPATAQAQSVDAILKDHFKAINQDKLEAAKTLTITGSMSMMGMDGPMTTTIKRPSKARSEINIMGMSIVSVMNGDKAYVSVPGQGVKELTGEDAKNSMNNASIDDKLFQAQKEKAKITLVGKENVNNVEAYKLKIVATNGDSSFAYVDTKTNYIVKLEINKTVQGTAAQIDMKFSDFKTFDGVTLATNIQTSAMGQDVTLKTEKVEFNKPVEDSLFDKPKE